MCVPLFTFCLTIFSLLCFYVTLLLFYLNSCLSFLFLIFVFYCEKPPWVKTVDAIWHTRLKMDLKIRSINVRGLGDQVKRREIFNWLRAKKIFSIFYSRNALYRSNKNDWRAEWGYQALFSCCTSKKAGLPYFLIITSPFKSLKHIPIPRDGL